MTESPVLEVGSLECSIGEKRILNSVSFAIESEEFVSLIGPNGAGKTTLLKCLMRILPFDEGAVRVNGTDLRSLGQKELASNIAYVPQADSRYIPFTVEEFVMMGRYPHLSPFTAYRASDRSAVREAMALTGINNLADRRMAGLSGGERQLVMMAAAIAQGAGIMLLDEPAAFLDPGHEQSVMRLLMKINARLGTTVLMVTHDINRAILTSGRVLVLDSGRLEYAGLASDLAPSGILEKIYRREFDYIPHPEAGYDIIVPDVIDYEG